MTVGRYIDSGFGLEAAARGALELLIHGLNDELDAQQDRWATQDQHLDQIRGLDYTEVTQEPIDSTNFYLGHKPSLIEESTPLTKYPNVSVMAFSAGPYGADTGDHHAEYSDRIYVETMVKASPTEGEEVCDKRAWRAAEAIHNVLSTDRSLMGSVAQVSDDPTCIVSEVFTRRQNPKEGSGPLWFWQAARVEYVVTKYSPFST